MLKLGWKLNGNKKEVYDKSRQGYHDVDLLHAEWRIRANDKRYRGNKHGKKDLDLNTVRIDLIARPSLEGMNF